MKTCLFESFSSRLAGIPANVIPRAIELEHWLLEDDLLYKRISDAGDVISVLSFCQFIDAVVNKDHILPVELPTTHVAFYREVVMRLIEAGELPVSTRERFDRTFSSSYLKNLSNN